jgi:hypothetical protein
MIAANYQLSYVSNRSASTQKIGRLVNIVVK